MTHYWLIAIGLLCVALNLEVNGLGICLPSCIGYGLIAGACWAIRDRQKVYSFAAVASGIQVVLTFPDLFRGQTTDRLDWLYVWTYWPFYILYLLTLLFLLIGLWREANLKGIEWVKLACIAIVPVCLVSTAIVRVIPVDDNINLLVAFFFDSLTPVCLAALYVVSSRLLE